VEVGLIYDVLADASGLVQVRMTLTSPNCPVAESLPVDVRVAAEAVEGVTGAEVEIVWDPPWEPSMMSEAARLELNLPF
jgi:metal-sulfur cluster biosynthetic enzyme